MRTLTLEEAKAYYDRFGAKQDSQTFYEAPAVRAMVAHSDFDQATSVLEFGCGTGRLALELLTSRLPPAARYQGVDVSATMVQLAAARLAAFAPRATATLVSEEAAVPAADASIDRFVSTYVLDLLPDATTGQVLAEAHRALRPDGLLCLVGITQGVTSLSRIMMGLWQWVFARRPAWVGGCRPARLAAHLARDQWQMRFHTVVVAWGIASEVVVAAPVQPAGDRIGSVA